MQLKNLNYKLAGFLVSLVLSLFFLTNYVFLLDKPISLSYVGDSFHVVITLRHYFDVILSGNYQNLMNLPIFYGFDNSLLFSEPFIGQVIFGLPIYALTRNILVTFNLLAIFSIVFSVWTMFILAHHLTNKFWPSILAGVIYVFNPFVMGHFPDNLHYYSLMWIPLIFLYIEKSLKEQTNKDIFLLFLMLTMQLFSSITFGALLSVVLPIYVLVRVYQLKIDIKTFAKNIIKPGFVVGAILFIVPTFFLGRLYTQFYSNEPIGRTIEETSFYSPWVSDVFFTGPKNLIYGGIREKVAEISPKIVFPFEEVTERNLFWGLGAFAIFLLAFRKSPNYLSYFMVIFCTILSLGPKVHIAQGIEFTNIYTALYKLNPLIADLRVPSRFMFIAFMFLGLIAAEYMSKFKSIKLVYLSILIIFIEYINVLWIPINISSQTNRFYTEVNNVSDVEVLLELPMGNLFSSIIGAKKQFIDSEYMLYASTLHNKKLINGYSSFTPEKYMGRIEYLTVNFPTRAKIEQLKKWDVDGIVLHKKEFVNDQVFQNIYDKLIKLGYTPSIKNDELFFFKIQ